MAEKKKILIIDDDPIFIEVFNKHLSKYDYQLEAAFNGKEGLKKTKEFKPDLILLDIIMPEIDGITVLKELKNNPKTAKIPVIMLTNIISDEKLEKAKKIGGEQYLVKIDNTLDDLHEKIKEVLE